MPVPGFQSFMLPVLELAADGKEHTLAEAREMLASKFNLTESERQELLPSGKQRRFNNRVAWAKVYLEQANVVSSPKRAVFIITQRGREILSEKPERIDLALLDRFEEFRQFRRGKANEAPGHPTEQLTGLVSTPEEMLEAAHQSLRAQLALDVLARVKAASPAFFERRNGVSPDLLTCGEMGSVLIC